MFARLTTMAVQVRTKVIALTVLATMNGCGMPTSDGQTESYIEDGVLWAYGSVQLADLEGPGSILLKRQTTDQTIDSAGQSTPITQWSLVGSVLADDERDLAYVDFHSVNERVLAYVYQVEAVPRTAAGEVFDVFALLKKSGRSYFQRQRVYLGTAKMNGADKAEMTLAPNLKVSLIADGVFAGQWAMHYPDIQKIIVKPWQGMCNRGVTQSPGQRPGQSPGQTPGQFDLCRPLPPEKDLCGGDPTQAGCRPVPPVAQRSIAPDQPQQVPNTSPATHDISGGQLDHQDDGVYVMSADKTEAKLSFTSNELTADDDQANATLCAKKFFAVARTTNGRVNQACVLTPAPASVTDGKLTCGVTVRFDNAQTYMERVCEVTAVFKEADTQKVQILKK